MCVFQHGERGISIHSLRMEGDMRSSICGGTRKNFNPLPPHGGRPTVIAFYFGTQTISIHSLRMEGDSRKTLTIMYFVSFQSTPSAWRETTPRTYFRKRPLHFNPLPPHGGRPGQVSLHAEGDSKTAQESVFHFAYPCSILQKRMQKTTFCTRKNGFFRKKGEKFGAKPSASFCAPMIRTDTFPLNFSHRISGSSMSMVSFAPICSTFD